METKIIIERLQCCIRSLVDKVELGTDTMLMCLPDASYKGYMTVVSKIIPNNNDDLMYRISGYILKQVELTEDAGLLNIAGCNHNCEIEGDNIQLDIFKDVSIVEPINNDIGYTLKVSFDASVELINEKEKLEAEEFEVSYKEEINN